MKKKTSCKTLKEFALEERKSGIDYIKRGFISQGKEELGHSMYFNSLLKKRRCKK